MKFTINTNTTTSNK